jgi:ligand-binding sensor domain-containing protein
MNRLIPILTTVILLFIVHCAFSQGFWKTYTTADGLAGNLVFCIDQDKLGNMWFGSWDAGVSKLDTNGVWTTFINDPSVAIYDIEIDSSNNKWFALSQRGNGYYGDYVVKFDDSTFTYYSPTGNPLSEAPPNVLGQDSLGQIWCGVLTLSAYWFDGNNWNYYYVPGLWDVWDAVSEIKTDRFGKLYFSHSNGISTKTQFLINVGQTADLAFDKQNRLWFAVDDVKPGLWMYDGNSLYRWTKDNGLINPLSQATDVAVDSNNNVWIANASYWYDLYGVSKFDGSTFTHFNVEDGLAAGYVFDIYVDKRGAIWFATDGGGVTVLHDTTKTSVRSINPPVKSTQLFSLFQNYPNPFNSNTCIKYNLNVPEKIELAIYNLLGREVKTLVEKHQSSGEYEINWDGADNSGKEVSSGIYLAVLKSSDFRQFIKISLIR